MGTVLVLRSVPAREIDPGANSTPSSRSASAVAAEKLIAEAGEESTNGRSRVAGVPTPGRRTRGALRGRSGGAASSSRQRRSPSSLGDLGGADDVREDERRQDVAGPVAPHVASVTRVLRQSNLVRYGRATRPNEPVRLTRIYTRGGDKGETSLGDGSRVSKLDPRVTALGDVDELNSFVGWAGGLDRVQNELLDLGADLSVPLAGNEDRLRITDDAVGRLEREIDEANAALPELKSFVLPGGSERAARLFLARAVCRRAERAVLCVPDTSPLGAVYLNRLSDLLFVLARAANAEAGVDEPLWRPGSA